jgi:hypothetical protein
VLLITSGSASYRIHTYAAEDFPHLPDVDAAPLRIRASALLRAVVRSCLAP